MQPSAPAIRSGAIPVPQHAWSVALVAVATLCIGLTNTDTLPVTAPLTIALFTALGFVRALAYRGRGVVPWFELGVIYLATVTLYLVYPLIGFLAIDQVYTAHNDGRLRSLRPDVSEVGRAAWLYVCHIVAFALMYLLVRGRLMLSQLPLRRPTPAIFLAMAIVYILIEAFVVFLGLFFDLSSSNYAGTYLAVRRLPLVFAQLLNHLGGVKYALSLMLLAALFCRYRTFKPLIATWLLVVAAITMIRLGDRTEFVLLVMAATMMYHAMVKPLSPGVVIMVAGTGLAGFVAFGALRNVAGDVGRLSNFNPFMYSSEFESMFGNAVHLNRVRGAIGDLPPAFYLADLTAVLPQQLAPFTKIDRADWYVTTFFPGYAAIGGGLAFGTIAEAILTGGWIAALWWGAALGFVFAKIHRIYARHAHRFWVFVFYVWIATLSYQAFRNTSFSHLVLFVYRFIPAVVLVNLLAIFIRRFALANPRAEARVW